MRHLLKQRVTISRPTIEPDAVGGQSRTYATLYEDLPASVQPVTTQWLALYGSKDIKISHLIFVADPVSLLADDRITYDGRTFVVTGVRNLVELSRVWEIACYEFLED